jgi:NADH dehydrogenase FAD-containing subunit
LDSGLPVGPDRGLLVNRYLQSVAHPQIFGGGDCICFEPRPLARVGVYAVRQNPVLLENLRRALADEALLPFVPQKNYLLAFNMGDGTAIVRWKFIVFNGRPGFALKDYLDRRFMKMFQE